MTDEKDPRAEAYDNVDYSARLKRDSKGQSSPNLLNIYLTLRFDEKWRGVIADDLFAERIVKPKPPPYHIGEAGPWTDNDDLFTMAWLTDIKGMDCTKQDVRDAVSMVAWDNRFHTVREYFEGLVWDGEERLWNWLSNYLGAGFYVHKELAQTMGEYLKCVGMKWLVSAVARVYVPGCKADHILILEGYQGLGKSSFLRDMAGAEWFSDTLADMASKDSYQQLRGKLIIEIPELDALNKADTTRAKAFTSKQWDYYRDSYAYRTEDHPRQCVFAGTTNQDEYFRDMTGNRRFWPVFCAQYERELFLQERDQVWAEAVALYKRGFAWHPTEAEAAMIERHCAFREIQDPWTEIIYGWVQSECSPNEIAGVKDYNHITVPRLLKEALKVDIARMDQHQMATRVGRCMKQLGFQKRQYESRAERSKFARFYYVDPDQKPVVQSEVKPAEF